MTRKSFLFTALLMLLVSVHLHGQNLEVQKPNYMIPKSYTGNVMTSKIGLTGSEFWTGYWDGVVNEQTQNIGVQQIPMDYGCAICYPAGSATTANKIIAGIKVSFPDSKNIGELKVFISTVLPKTAEDADVCWQSVTNITGVQNPDDPFNEVRFKKPYKVDSSKPVYIGYFFKVTGGNSNAEKFPCLIQGGPDKKDALWLSFGGEAWADYNGNGFGVLAMQVLMSGEFEDNADNAAYISSEIGKVVATKDSYDLPLEVENAGNKGISSLTVVTDVNGIVTENEVKPEKTITGIGSKFAFKAHINTPDKTGSYNFSVKITRVNGVEIVNSYESKGEMILLSRIVDHKVFFEEFSDMWDGWSPRGLVAIDKTKQLYGDSVIIVSAHGGDALECKDYAQILKTVSGCPNAHLDRTFMGLDPYFGKQDDGYGIGKEIKACMSVIPVAEIEAKPSVHGNIVMANAEVKFLYSGDASDYAVGYILTEDGMTNSKWSQANNYSQFKGQGIEDAEPLFEPWVNGNSQVKDVVYDGVVIAAKGIETGVDGSIPVVVNEDVVVSHIEEFDLSLYNKIQNKDSMNLVVVLFDRTTGYIINADITKFSEKSGTEDLKYIEVDVKTPGTLGIEVLKQVNVLQDVSLLRVRGKLNDEDLAKLKQMTNILGCDLSQAEFDILPDETFAGLEKLYSLKLPEGLKTIGYKAFYECGNLGELIMPNSVIKLVTNNNEDDGYSDTFEWCWSLKKLVFSDSLEYIPSSVASNCSSLKTIHLPANLKRIGRKSFYNNNSLTDINIPNTLKEIGYDAFYGCAIDSLSLPESLRILGEGAFSYCDSLRYLNLPSSILSYNNTFSNCSSINRIVINAIVPPMIKSNDIFYNVIKSNVKLIVPPLGINAYKLDSYWYQFSNIEPNKEWSGNIFIAYKLYELLLPDEIPADWKTNVTMASPKSRFNLYGQSILSANRYEMYESYEKDDYYNYKRNSDPYNYNYCASFINNANMRADDIAVNFSLKEKRWNFMSLPFTVSSLELDPNISFAVRTYSGEARANGNMNETWQNVKNWEDLLPNVGFIFHSDNPNNDYTLIRILAKNDIYKNYIFINSDVQVTLKEYISEFAHNRSWNFIGNPYPCFYDTRAMDFTAPITVWDTYNQNYAAYSPIDDSYILRPFEAFFVQKPIDADKINFSKEGRQHDRAVRTDVPYRKEAYFANGFKERSVFNITLKDNDGHADRTRFVINDAAEKDYEISRDANKFKSENKEIPQIFTIENGVEFSINERPMHDAIIQLGVYAGKSGSYEIGLSGNSDREVILYDNNLGKKVNLTEGSYLFDAEQGTDLERFEIRLGNDVTGVEEISADEQKDTIYDLQGRKLNNVSSKGVFIINGKKVTK